jgi:hypothetical protein
MSRYLYVATGIPQHLPKSRYQISLRTLPTKDVYLNRDVLWRNVEVLTAYKSDILDSFLNYRYKRRRISYGYLWKA